MFKSARASLLPASAHAGGRRRRPRDLARKRVHALPDAQVAVVAAGRPVRARMPAACFGGSYWFAKPWHCMCIPFCTLSPHGPRLPAGSRASACHRRLVRHLVTWAKIGPQNTSKRCARPPKQMNMRLCALEHGLSLTRKAAHHALISSRSRASGRPPAPRYRGSATPSAARSSLSWQRPLRCSRSSAKRAAWLVSQKYNQVQLW